MLFSPCHISCSEWSDRSNLTVTALSIRSKSFDLKEASDVSRVVKHTVFTFIARYVHVACDNETCHQVLRRGGGSRIVRRRDANPAGASVVKIIEKLHEIETILGTITVE